MKEVYVCSYNDEVLYVGYGDLGRHKHCNSGCSHVYELNKLHFSGADLKVDVISVHKTKDIAYNHETELILKLKPKYNIKKVSWSSNNSETVTFKKDLDYNVKVCYAKYGHRHQALVYIDAALKLIDTIGFQNLKGGVRLPMKFCRDNLKFWYDIVVFKRSDLRVEATSLWLYAESNDDYIYFKLIL